MSYPSQPYDQQPGQPNPYGNMPQSGMPQQPGYGAAPQDPYSAGQPAGGMPQAMPYAPQMGMPGQQQVPIDPATGEPPLNMPWYGIDFMNACKRFFKKYATFTGRASKSEYWWAYLMQFLIGLVASIPVTIASATMDPYEGAFNNGLYVFGTILSGVVTLALLVPAYAVGWRRMHDTGKSGLFYLLSLIPCAGFIIMIVLCIGESSPEGEQYDEQFMTYQ